MQDLTTHWPQWLIDSVIVAYKQGERVEDIAITIQRKIGSVRHKLVRHGVYISKSNAHKQLKATTAQEHGF